MKLLVSDFDGTLSYNHRHISDTNLEALKEWKKQGNKFAIATGRSFFTIMPAIKKYNLDVDYVICNNGGAIYKDGEVIYSENLGIHLDDLDEYINEFHVNAINATDLNGLYYNAFLNKLDIKALLFFLYLRFVGVKDKMMKRKHLTELIQITLMTRSKEEAHKLSTVINERFHVNAVPNSYVIDIGKGSITKSTAIHHVIEAFESFDDVYTIGDELNDKEMLRDFNGYTMNHGLDELKEITLGSYNEVSELIYDLLKEEF